MLNYIKSECYRIIHTRYFYLTSGILVGLTVLFHLGLRFSGMQGSPYATTSFSYSNLVANPMIYALLGGIIAFQLYEGNRKNGNLKNTVASGVPRTRIFLGECLVSVLVATILMAVTVAAWIFCAQAFLAETGPVRLETFLQEIPAVYLIAVASLISAIWFLELFEKSMAGILAWVCVWLGIPKVLMLVGMQVDAVYELALWLPNNFFSMVNGLHVNLRECQTVWDTVGGFMRCLISGAAGTMIFLLAGLGSLRRRDL